MTKTRFLRIQDANIVGTDGQTRQCCDSIIYLGGLNSDGRPAAEVTRRVGGAKGVFEQLLRIWKHANISRSRRKEILDALVVSELLYVLESLLCTSPTGRSSMDSIAVFRGAFTILHIPTFRE